MSALPVLAAALQVVAVLAGAPLVVGGMRQVRARLEGRAGGGVGQPWRDLRKLLRKQQITPQGTTIVFALAPAIVAGSTLLIAAIIPLIALGSPLDSTADLFGVVDRLVDRGEPRAAGIAGKPAGVRRAGDRAPGRDRSAAGGQPLHPPRTDDDSRGHDP